MQYRICLLRLAAVALALATCCVCARDTTTAASLQYHQYHQRHEHSLLVGANSGPLSSKRRRDKRSTAPAPWLTVATGLRGGGKGGAAVDVPRGGSTVATGVKRSAKICGLFGLSYVCSVMFNVNNKRALLLVPLPWTYAALNLLIGSAVAVVSWSVKIAPWPRITRQDIGALVPMGFLHAVSHLTVVLGLGAGAVSFLQTVKASEACFTALLSYLFLGQTLPLPVYLTLLPVVVGVALTCCGQGLRFSWLALLSALVSNLSNALRNVLIVKNIGPAAARRRRRHRDNNESKGESPPRATSSFLRPATTSGVTATDAFVNNPIARKIRSAAALANTRAGGAAAGSRGRSGLADLAPGDTYRLLTVVGAALLVPAAAYFERDSWPRLWRGARDACAALLGRPGSSSPLGEALRSGAGTAAAAAAAAGGGGGVTSSGTVAEAAVTAAARGDWAEAFRRALLSGVCFNLFYDLTFRLLGQLHPVTHAVGNTIKRIVVIGAGAFVFGGDLGGVRGALGSGLAVVGVLGYSLAKAWCKPTKDRGGRG